MNARSWVEVRALFEELIDTPPAVARERLDRVRMEDAELAAEVSSLLEHHADLGGFLEQPPVLAGDDDSAVLVPGTLAGTYRIEREIGRGGMGRVYLATDTRLERRVCLKSVRPELADVPGYRERLRREARLAASITHPGICAVHVLEEIDGRLFLVTEYIEGRTLREELRQGQPSATAIDATYVELASALAAAHARGITHGDLKPENIMRAADGRLKVLDFGLARLDRAYDTQTHGDLTAAFGGTPAYMAPEQIDGARPDPRSDVFALGVVIYECATTMHPFAGPTTLATTARIVGQEARPVEELRSDLRPQVSAAIDRSLRKSPIDRFDSAGMLLEALRADDAVVARPGQRWRWWQFHQAAILVTYLLAAVVAWQMHQWDRATATLWAFLGIGVLAAAGGTLRSHLLFTARQQRARLRTERRRARPAILTADLLLALLLFADAMAIAGGHAVAAVLTMGLATGIAAAVTVIEPSTSAGAFGDDW
jgi:hypothetical protein